MAAGYHLIKRNLRCQSGEVDIVVYKEDVVVFVEVKHWKTLPIEDLERSINASKQRRIVGCAKEFLSKNATWFQCRPRFDIVHVGPDLITHFENAFTESGFQ